MLPPLLIVLLLAVVLPCAVANRESASVRTVAGNYPTSASGLLDGVGTNARLLNPHGIAREPTGDYVFVDYNGAAVRRLSKSTGAVTTIAGSYPSTIASYVNAVGLNAQFNGPGAILVDQATGIIYVSDRNNHAIRTINSGGTVATFAGAATPMAQQLLDGTGTGARFGFPFGLAFDRSGNIVVADWGNSAIRRVSSGAVVTTIAGTAAPGFVDGVGTDARLWNPIFVAVDLSNYIYIADERNYCIRRLSPGGQLTTLTGLLPPNTAVPGFVDGVGTSALFNKPFGIAFTPDYKHLVVVDALNSAIRTLDVASLEVRTIAGSFPPTVENSFHDGYLRNARFNQPKGMIIDDDGTMWICDNANNALRRIANTTWSASLTEGLSKTASVSLQHASDTQSGTETRAKSNTASATEQRLSRSVSQTESGSDTRGVASSTASLSVTTSASVAGPSSSRSDSSTLNPDTPTFFFVRTRSPSHSSASTRSTSLTSSSARTVSVPTASLDRTGTYSSSVSVSRSASQCTSLTSSWTVTRPSLSVGAESRSASSSSSASWTRVRSLSASRSKSVTRPTVSPSPSAPSPTVAVSVSANGRTPSATSSIDPCLHLPNISSVVSLFEFELPSAATENAEGASLSLWSSVNNRTSNGAASAEFYLVKSSAPVSPFVTPGSSSTFLFHLRVHRMSLPGLLSRWLRPRTSPPIAQAQTDGMLVVATAIDPWTIQVSVTLRNRDRISPYVTESCALALPWDALLCSTQIVSSLSAAAAATASTPPLSAPLNSSNADAISSPSQLLLSKGISIVFTLRGAGVLVSPSMLQAVSRTGLGLAIGAGSPMLGTVAARIGLLLALADCSYDPKQDDGNGLLGWSFGDPAGAYMRGAVAGNLLFALALCSVLLVLVGAAAFVGAKVYGTTWLGNVTRVCNYLHVPSVFYIPFSIILQPTLASSVSLLVWNLIPGDTLVGAIGLLTLLLLIVLPNVVVMTVRFPCVVAARDANGEVPTPTANGEPELSSASMTAFSAAAAKLKQAWRIFHGAVLRPVHRVWFAPNCEWRAAVKSSSACAETFLSRHLLLFDEYSCVWFPVLDMLSSVVIGIVAGLTLNDVRACRAVLSMVTLVFTALLLASCRRPCRNRAGNVYLFVANGLGFASSLAMLVNIIRANSSAVDAALVCLILLGFLSTLKALPDVMSMATAVFALCGRDLKFLLQGMWRQEHVKPAELVVVIRDSIEECANVITRAASSKREPEVVAAVVARGDDAKSPCEEANNNSDDEPAPLSESADLANNSSWYLVDTSDWEPINAVAIPVPLKSVSEDDSGSDGSDAGFNFLRRAPLAAALNAKRRSGSVAGALGAEEDEEVASSQRGGETQRRQRVWSKFSDLRGADDLLSLYVTPAPPGRR